MLLDTEGFDAQILRALIEHCRRDSEAWPLVVQFETMGHCDKLEGWCSEWAVIGCLEAAGYVLLHYSCSNTHLVWRKALQTEDRLWEWCQGWRCQLCYSRSVFPYVTDNTGTYCRRCCEDPERRPGAAPSRPP